MRVIPIRKRDRFALMYVLLAIASIPAAAAGAALSPPGVGSWILPAAALVGCILCAARALHLHYSRLLRPSRVPTRACSPRKGVECCSLE